MDALPRQTLARKRAAAGRRPTSAALPMRHACRTRARLSAVAGCVWLPPVDAPLSLATARQSSGPRERRDAAPTRWRREGGIVTAVSQRWLIIKKDIYTLELVVELIRTKIKIPPCAARELEQLAIRTIAIAGAVRPDVRCPRDDSSARREALLLPMSAPHRFVVASFRHRH
eukprot:scaffold31493_cov101-Isochrysis_galbana.AAC.3